MNHRRMGDEKENSSLELRLKSLEAQVNQHLTLKKDDQDKKPLGLQIEMARKLKTIKRLKYRAAAYCQEIAIKDISLKMMEDHIKTIWNLLLIFGNKLEKIGELADNEKNQLRNRYKELFAIGIVQNKDKEDIFDILGGLPVDSLEILNNSENCNKELCTKSNQVFSNDKNIISTNYSTSELFSPRNIASSSDDIPIKTNLTSQSNMSSTLFNDSNEQIEDTLEYEDFSPGVSNCTMEITEHPPSEASQSKGTNETLLYTYAKETFSNVSVVQPRLLANTLSNVEDSFLKQLSDPSEPSISMPCISDEVDKEREIDLVLDRPHGNDETLTYVYAKASSSDASEVQPKLPTNTFLNGKDSYLKHLSDSSNSDNSIPCVSKEICKGVEDELVKALPHDKNDESLQQSTCTVVDTSQPSTDSVVEDLALTDEDSNTGLSHISKIPQNNNLSSNHVQNECKKSPIKHFYLLTPICNKKKSNTSCNKEEHNLDLCSNSDSQGSTYFEHDSEENDCQEVCVNQTFPPAKRQRLSKSHSLTSSLNNDTVDPNTEPVTFRTDSSENYSNSLSEKDTDSEISSDDDLNKEQSKEKEIEILTPIQQTWHRKKRFSRIYTFHLNDPKSKRRKSTFVEGLSKDASQTSQWNTKFKKINEQLKKDDSLQVNNVGPNKLSKSIRNLKLYSVTNKTKKLSASVNSKTIQNSELESDDSCETQKEACTSKDTPTQSKVSNSITSNPKVKHFVEKNKINASGNNMKIIEGNYITYVRSKKVNLDKSNQSNRSGSSLTVNTNFKTNNRLQGPTRLANKVNKVKNKTCPSQKQIQKFFQDFSDMELSQINFKSTVGMLVKKLSSTRFFYNTSELLFHTLTYLFKSKKNPLLSYCINEDSAVQLPLDENCIVTALFKVESKRSSHLEGIMRHAMTTLHHLILVKKKFSKLSLGSLCRVLAEICKRQGNCIKPVMLCADLLKMKHPFATYLIASVAVVWKELFKIKTNLPAEEVLFHSSILYGACKSVQHLPNGDRDICLKIISTYFTAPIVNCAKSAIPNLKNLIEMRCQDDSWNSRYLTSALVILARYEDWDWIQEHLLTYFILPNLNKFGRETLNENAFNIFCNLYVDVFLLQPGNPLDTTLCKFINDSSTFKNENFVDECAALALIRFVYSKNRKLPTFLDSWLQRNQQNPKVQQIESLFWKNKMGEDLKSLQFEDIL